jgi:predicted transcriptional regulator
MRRMTLTKGDVLEEIGLSKNESKVYLALLDLGPSSINEINKKSDIHRTNVYDSLKRLTEKGYVNFISKNGKKLYEATDPSYLMDLVREKEAHLADIMPQLKLSTQLAQTQPNEAHIYEGVAALKHILNHFIELGQTRYVYGVPKTASEILGPFLNYYHKKRTGKKLKMYHIYNSDAKDRIHFLNALPYTESRFLPREYDSPVATSICGDEVVLILYSKKPLTIQIKNQDIANKEI